MGALKVKLKAATVIESLIAMVIIIVIFGIATMIYVNLLEGDKQPEKLKAIFILKEESIKTKREHSFIDENKSVGDFFIEKKVEYYESSQNLFLLKLSAFNKENKLIYTNTELILNE